jgi:BirA family biotin operon repressor/biotin-[acetyl-CoA-carboxylase] ligase
VISWSIETHDVVKSTQNIIKGFAEIGQPEGKVVRADEQTGGQGRHGRTWVSEAGNLYMSLLLRPTCHARHIGQISMVAGLAVARAIRKFIKDPDALVLKWPNDANLEGEKCAGILLESSLGAGQSIQWVAVGIGINIESAPEGMGTFLNAHAVRQVEAGVVFKEVLSQMASAYDVWSREGFDEIRQSWLALAHARGTPLKVKIGPQIEKGLFYDVDDQGNLLLQDSQLRLRKVAAGEIYL